MKMNYLTGFIFIVLVAIIIRQRHQFEKMRQSGKFMSYYAKLNENAKLHAEFRADTAETLLKMYGYDFDKISSGDTIRVIVSEAEKQVMVLEHEKRRRELDEHDKCFEQEKAKYESEIA